VREAQLAIPLRPDLFHILQEAHRLTRRLESAAYKAIETAERARRADLEARGIIRRRGRRLKIKVPLLQLFWNHSTFERGKRTGHSPLELAGVSHAPSLAAVLDQLFGPSLVGQPI
jgi:hypothetical protein